MSGPDSANDVKWSSISERVISKFAKARENTQLHGKFIDRVKSEDERPRGYELRL